MFSVLVIRLRSLRLLSVSGIVMRLRMLLLLIFFFKQKTAYEIGLGIPAEPLFRSKKRDEIEAGKSYCSRRFGGATCDDKSAQIYARFDKNDWRIQPAEFYRFHDAEVNTFGYF